MTLSEILDLVQIVASILGPVVVIVTIPLLVRQTRVIAEGARSATFAHYRDQSARLNDLFLANPDLRPYFYEGRQVDSEDDLLRQRVEAMAEAILDVLEAIVLHQRYFKRVWARNTFEEYAGVLFRPGSILTEYLAAHPTWWPEEVHALARWCLAAFPVRAGRPS